MKLRILSWGRVKMWDTTLPEASFCCADRKVSLGTKSLMALNLIASNPQPLDVSETANITICENARVWGGRRVVFLVCSLLYHDNHQQRYFTLHVLAYFRLFLLLQFVFLNFWPSKGKFNIKPPHWSVRIYLIR